MSMHHVELYAGFPHDGHREVVKEMARVALQVMVDSLGTKALQHPVAGLPSPAEVMLNHCTEMWAEQLQLIAIAALPYKVGDTLRTECGRGRATYQPSEGWRPWITAFEGTVIRHMPTPDKALEVLQAKGCKVWAKAKETPSA